MKTHTMTMTTEALSKSALARRLKTSRTTIQKYLDRADSPRPVRPGLYDLEAVAKYINATSTNLPSGDEFKTLRVRLLRASCETAELELKIRKGEYYPKTVAVPVFSAMTSNLVGDLREKFEAELPPRYVGKSQIENALMNQVAVDFIIARFIAGQRPLTGSSPATPDGGKGVSS